MKKKYVTPHTAIVRVCGDLLQVNFLRGSIGRISQEKIFQTDDFFKVEENIQFDTEAKKKAFWDDWNNGAD